MDDTSLQSSERVERVSPTASPPGVIQGNPRFRMLSDRAAWQRLPPAERAGGQTLPTWARMLVEELPQTTAALLELDLAHRVNSPVPPALRAAMRWVAADANRCEYAIVCAAADGARSGVDNLRLEPLRRGNFAGWSTSQQAALKFARKMTVDSDSVTDEEFAELVSHFGGKLAASMILLMAYANFQDRLLICLGAPLEAGGSFPALDAGFDPNSFVLQTTPPPPLASPPDPAGDTLVNDEPELGGDVL